MLITIAEFAQQRGLETDTVATYVRRHESIQADSFKKGRLLALDTESDGYKELAKQYPLPQPVQVIEDTESRQKLIKAQEAIIQLQGKLQEATAQLAQAEATKLLLEDKEEQLAKTEKRLKESEDHERQARTELKELNDKIQSLQDELSNEKAKSWWDKLRGR